MDACLERVKFTVSENSHEGRELVIPASRSQGDKWVALVRLMFNLMKGVWMLENRGFWEN